LFEFSQYISEFATKLKTSVLHGVHQGANVQKSHNTIPKEKMYTGNSLQQFLYLKQKSKLEAMALVEYVGTVHGVLYVHNVPGR